MAACCNPACALVTPANAPWASLIACCTLSGSEILLSANWILVSTGTPRMFCTSAAKPEFTACWTPAMVWFPFPSVGTMAEVAFCASVQDATRSAQVTLPISCRSTFCTRFPRVAARNAFQPSSPSQVCRVAAGGEGPSAERVVEVLQHRQVRAQLKVEGALDPHQHTVLGRHVDHFVAVGVLCGADLEVALREIGRAHV